LIGLDWLDTISDWKYYDKYWDEEGEQNFKDYKKRMKDDNSSGAANLSNK